VQSRQCWEGLKTEKRGKRSEWNGLALRGTGGTPFKQFLFSQRNGGTRKNASRKGNHFWGKVKDDGKRGKTPLHLRTLKVVLGERTQAGLDRDAGGPTLGRLGEAKSRKYCFRYHQGPVPSEIPGGLGGGLNKYDGGRSFNRDDGKRGICIDDFKKAVGAEKRR